MTKKALFVSTAITICYTCICFTQNTPGDELVNIALKRLHLPYIYSSLENPEREQLLMPEHGFDCYTLVERALAEYVDSLCPDESTMNIRYREGRIEGYCSRLHYLSEWILVNQKRGYFKDITHLLKGARKLRLKPDFMSTHPSLYPGIHRDDCMDEIRKSESLICDSTFYFIPKEVLHSAIDSIQNGDIIAITTRKKGLDYSHVGIAIKINNKIHLLHASSVEKKVVVSKRTLLEYLRRNPAQTGITVLRISETCVISKG